MRSSDEDVQIENPRCDGCGACVAVCPRDALTLNEKSLSKNQDLCTKCEKCIAVCPIGAITR